MPPLQRYPEDKITYDQLPVMVASTNLLGDFSLATTHGTVCVNPGSLAPGDAVLFGASGWSRLIVPYQALALWRIVSPGSSSIAASVWTHVGIYDGNGELWDAVSGANVRHRKMTAVLAEKRPLLVRRLVLPIDANDLALVLNGLVGSTYTLTVPQIYRPLIARLRRKSVSIQVPTAVTAPAKDPVICSRFVERAFIGLFRHTPINDVPIVLPCDFAVSPHFRDVDLAWHRV